MCLGVESLQSAAGAKMQSCTFDEPFIKQRQIWGHFLGLLQVIKVLS